MLYGIELISESIIHRGQGISRLLIYVCNIHLFLELGNRKLQEATLHRGPLGCLRSRQAGPLRINIGYSKEGRFLLKRNNCVSIFPYVIPLHRRCLLKTSLLNQQKFLQNGSISISKDMPIEVFKRQNDGWGKLSVSPRSKSRNGGRVTWDHRRG
jgi:hypothetical protein